MPPDITPVVEESTSKKMLHRALVAGFIATMIVILGWYVASRSTGFISSQALKDATTGFESAPVSVEELKKATVDASTTGTEITPEMLRAQTTNR